MFSSLANDRCIYCPLHTPGGYRCQVRESCYELLQVFGKQGKKCARPYSCFSSVAFTVAVAPAFTVIVLSQVLKPDFPNFILWSPTASRSDEGVLPMNFSSTVISAPSGVDLISTVESAGSVPLPFCVAAGSAVA